MDFARKYTRLYPQHVSPIRGHATTRRAKPQASRSASSSPRNSARSPRSGNTRGRGGQMMIYTKKPLTLPNGRRVAGHWTKAIDPEGKYGGPYSDVRNLLANPRYRAQMTEDDFSQTVPRVLRRAAPPRATRRHRGHSRSRSSSRSHSR